MTLFGGEPIKKSSSFQRSFKKGEVKRLDVRCGLGIGEHLTWLKPFVAGRFRGVTLGG